MLDSNPEESVDDFPFQPLCVTVPLQGKETCGGRSSDALLRALGRRIVTEKGA